MIRVSSQITFCSPDTILRRTIVELNDKNILTHLFSLDDGNFELSQTLFFDGILSQELVSVKQNTGNKEISSFVNNYNYFDFSESLPTIELVKTNNPLILDVGTNSFNRLNSILPYLSKFLNAFSIFEIIAACTYYPALVSGLTTGLTENKYTHLMLWENVDLALKKLTSYSQLKEMNSLSSIS